MKKIMLLSLVVIMILGIAGTVSAEPNNKGVEISLVSSANPALVGETVTFTAITLKRGSEYTDEWVGATKLETVLNDDGYYVSKAVVKAEDAGNVTYKITMSSGDSGTSFSGQASIYLNVENNTPVTAIEIKNITPVYHAYNTTFYEGDIYIIKNDSVIYYGKTYFSFNFSEASGQTEIQVPVEVDGQTLMFNVQVTL